MKSARIAAYWYATAIVLVASALMRGISRPPMFPWWFVGAELGAGIVFGVLAWWFGRGSAAARVILMIAGIVVVLGAVALVVTGRAYEFGAVPAVLGVIVTTTGGEARGRSRQVSVSAVGDWTPAPAGPQPFGPSPAQPWFSREDGGSQGQSPGPGHTGGPDRSVPPQHDTQPRRQQPPPQHGTQPQWPDPRRPAPQHGTLPPQHPTGPPQHGTLPPQHPTGPPQHGTLPPQHPTGPPQHATYPPAGPPSRQPPARGAPGDPPWRRVPGPAVPALPPDQPPVPPPGHGDADDVPRSRARHAAQPPSDADAWPAADPEVQWAPRRRRHARPEQTEGGIDPSHAEPEEN